MHCWATGDATGLAQKLRPAVDATDLAWRFGVFAQQNNQPETSNRAQSQTSQTQSGQQGPQTFTGCLTSANNVFTLTVADPPIPGATAQNTAFTVKPSGSLDLKSHVDHKVEVKGTAGPASDAARVVEHSTSQATGTSGAIVSSLAGGLYGIGYADGSDGSGVNKSASTIELKLTVAGDANLDGTANLSDFLLLTRHFGQAGGWTAGDFNYDQTVNLSDLLVLTRNFSKSLPPTLSAADLLLPATHPLSAQRRAVR